MNIKYQLLDKAMERFNIDNKWNISEHKDFKFERVTSLPTPSSLLEGVALRLSSDRKVYFCNGNEWLSMVEQDVNGSTSFSGLGVGQSGLDEIQLSNGDNLLIGRTGYDYFNTPLSYDSSTCCITLSRIADPAVVRLNTFSYVRCSESNDPMDTRLRLYYVILNENDYELARLLVDDVKLFRGHGDIDNFGYVGYSGLRQCLKGDMLIELSPYIVEHQAIKVKPMIVANGLGNFQWNVETISYHEAHEIKVIE